MPSTGPSDRWRTTTKSRRPARRCCGWSTCGTTSVDWRTARPTPSWPWSTRRTTALCGSCTPAQLNRLAHPAGGLAGAARRATGGATRPAGAAVSAGQNLKRGSQQVVQLHKHPPGPRVEAPVGFKDLEEGHWRPERGQVPHRGRFDVAPLTLAHELGRIEQEGPGHPDERLVGRMVVLARLELAPGRVRDPGPAGRLVLGQPEAPPVLPDVLADRRPVDGARLLALRRYRHDPSHLSLRRSAPCVLILLDSDLLLQAFPHSSPVVTELCARFTGFIRSSCQ